MLLTVLYLIPAIGVSVNAHWCGTKMMTLSIDSGDSDKCACGMEMPSGCCKNLHAVFQLTDNQKAASELTFSKDNFAKPILPAEFQSPSVLFAQEIYSQFSAYHAPPPDGKLPVYLSNCVFRI